MLIYTGLSLPVTGACRIAKFAILDTDRTDTIYVPKVALGMSILASSASHAQFGSVFSILLPTHSALACLFPRFALRRLFMTTTPS